jgi:uncharacterized membrane protein YedE/YeeE
MGVSGSVARALGGPRDEGVPDDARGLAAALADATRDEFGVAAPIEPTAIPVANLGGVPWSAHVTFLAAILVGALVASFASGQLAVQSDLGPTFAAVASGWRVWAVLALGGALVGFGTRLAGGCTSGHGLSGCGRLAPASLVVTATFFGAAVALSLALDAWSAR